MKRRATALYIRRGAFPMIQNESDGYTLVNDIVDSILLLDVAERFAIEDVDLLKRVLADSIGSPISTKLIARSFKSRRQSVGLSIIQSYLETMRKAFLIHKVERYDVRGRSPSGSKEQEYLADTAIIFAMLGYHCRASWRISSPLSC